MRIHLFFSQLLAVVYDTFTNSRIHHFLFQLLAVVYDTFTKMEKRKLKKLMLHKREACEYAFRLLVSRQVSTPVSLDKENMYTSPDTNYNLAYGKALDTPNLVESILSVMSLGDKDQ